MVHLILNEEQVRILRAAEGLVQMCDAAGSVVAHARPVVPLDQLDPADRKMVEDYLRNKGKPREKGYSSQHVREMLQALEKEWQRTGGFDKAYMDEFLARWQAKNAA
jgi:hypothetical protein